MNDCTNAEMRDQLPDLLHERLDVSARAAVLAHVNDCVDCRDELQLLRDVRGAFDRATPRVDVNYVIGALPLPPKHTIAAVPARKRVWADWRIAAAVTLIVAGGSSLAVLRSNDQGAVVRPADTTVAQAPIVNPVAASMPNAGTAAADSTASTVASTATASAAPVNEAPSDSRFSGLDEQQLKTLLGDIEKLQPVPVADPEPVMIRVSGTSSTEGV